MANKLYEEQYIQDIAASIRSKNNKNTTYKVSEMAAAINKLKKDSKPYKDVNFIDYDGTVLYSYTASEALNLTQLPDNPTHDGLTSQGWNWTLDDIQSYVSEYGALNIGQMYITDDGSTRLYIQVRGERKTVPLCFRQSVDEGVEIDWGDGSAIQTLSGSGTTNIFPTHTYSESGDYVIKLKPSGSCTLTLGSAGPRYCVLGRISNENRVYQNMLVKVEIGNNAVISGYFTFQYCYGLREITIPEQITTLGGSTFSNCISLSSITIPKSVATINGSAFNNCYGLLYLMSPKNITDVEGSAFQNCYRLFDTFALSQVTSLGSYAFSNCQVITKLVVPKEISNILANTFDGCSGMKTYDFSQHTQVPTLANISAFSGIPTDCQIIVPDSLYSTWIAATNWSTYASNIVKASEA